MLYGEESRDQLNKRAEKIFSTQVPVSQKERRKLYDDLLNKFNMPTKIAEEMITFKKDITEFTPFEIFCVMYFLDRDYLKRVFTDAEIEAFSNDKFEDIKIDFPLVFNDMVQITETQWIGKITAKELMQLKHNGLINYDENEQRALKRVKFGETEIYRPFVNRKSVADIKDSMERGTYIPDTLTLNMPDGSEYSFEDHKMTVYSLPKDMFNLDDGYHRYLAISQISDFDPDWDYTMELRIVSFSNTKANDFIYQQDQKTRMKRIASETYNTNSIPNKIIARINEDPRCNIQGLIGRNNSYINSGVLGKLISTLFIKEKISKEKEMATVISIQKELIKKFNLLTEQDPWFLEKYDDIKLFVTMFIFASDAPENNYAKDIRLMIDSLSDEEKKAFNVSSINVIRKKAVNILAKKLEEIEG